MEMLLHAHADINVVNDEGETLLHTSVHRGDDNISMVQ